MTGLPPWLTPLPDAAAQREIDRWAIEEQGVPGIELMERAGAHVTRAVERVAPDGRVTVVCGKGNNGGDGLVVARLLRELGRAVTVVCTDDPSQLRGDARVNLERLPGGAPVRLDGGAWGAREGRDGDGGAAAAAVEPGPFDGAAAIVDAVLGTGFQGQPRGAAAQAIDAILRAGAPVVSVDVPSGVDASSGEVGGAAVSAVVTVTFHAAKPGLWIRPGKERAGEVHAVDIGIPRGAPGEPSIGLIAPAVRELLPHRGAASTKFSSGHVLVVGGSRGLTGAPRMAAEASMRAGAGYVTACVPASVQSLIAGAATPETMTKALPDEDGHLVEGALDAVLDAAARGGALALGPGLGRDPGAFAFARTLAARAELALVLDADGLNAHAGDALQRLAARRHATVLTPHAGELGRLLELDSAAIEARRLHHVRDAARRSGAVVVLKGDDTLVARPDGIVALSAGGSPGLATAGTGDVLSGVVAALLAQGLDAFSAAAAGVWLHAHAGRVAALRLGTADAVIATDVIAALPAARTGEDAHA